MIRVNELAGWCRRVGASVSAGLDIVQVLDREAGRQVGDIARSPLDRRPKSPQKDEDEDDYRWGPPSQKPFYDYRETMKLRQQAIDDKNRDNPKKPWAFLYSNPQQLWAYVSDRVRNGYSLYEAFSEIENHFPKLFVPMIGVGEKAGSLGETLNELAKYYEYQLRLKREFWRVMTYPFFQLGAVVFVLSAVIFICGFITMQDGTPIDLLGFGLSGGAGVLWFWTYCFMITLAVAAVYYFVKTRIAGGAAIAQWVLNWVPKIRSALRCFAMSRFTWALHMTTKTGMDIREAMKLSFDVAAYAPITNKLPGMLEKLEDGGSIEESFPKTETLDHEFHMYVSAGEEAGELPESMGRLSEEYLDRAKLHMKQLSVAFSFAVFFLVAAIIIFFIFRIAGVYLGEIQDALKM